IVSMHLTKKAMPITQAAPEAELPRWLERVVERAMAKKRDERYASAQEFLQALDGSGGPSRGMPAVPRSPSLRLAHAAAVARDGVLDAWSFLVRRAREAGVPWPRAFAGAGVALVLALVALV